MNCRTCGAVLEEGSVFCIECGTKVEEFAETQPKQIKYCPNCGTPNEESAVSCKNCMNVFRVTSQPKNRMKRNLFSGKIKKVLLVLAVLAAFVAVILVVRPLFGSLSKNTPVVYLKDNEIASVKGKNPYVISEDFFKDKDSDDATGPSVLHRWLVQVSENGKYLYYPKDCTYVNFAFDLCRKKLGSEKAKETEIESGVSGYKLLGGDELVYHKQKNDTLYYYDGKESEKIDTDVQAYYISEDYKSIVWLRGKHGVFDLYYSKIGSGKDEKIASDVFLYSVSDDLNQIVYRSDGTLCILYDLKEEEEIEDDAYEVRICNKDDKMEIYYTIEEGNYELSYADYADDDMKEYYQGDIAYSATTYSLHRYVPEKRKSEEILEDNVTTLVDQSGNAIVYETINEEYISKMEFSDFSTNYSSKLVKWNVVIDGKVYDIEVEEEYATLYDFICVKDQYYVVLRVENDKYRVLYELEPEGDEGILSEVTDEYFDRPPYNLKDTFYYFAKKDYENGTATLYCGTEEIADNVITDSVRALSEDGDIMYLTDPRNGGGTLCYYKSGKSGEISEDVIRNGYVSNDKGEVAFLSDYSVKKSEGDLFVFRNDDVTLIDEEVTGVLYF